MPPEAPGAKVPVSQADSVVSVAVWAVVSLLVHVTTSPTLAVMVAGLKAKFAIVAATGNIYSGLWYPIVVAAGSFVIALIFLPETKDRDINRI